MLTSFKEIGHPIYLFHDHMAYIFKKIFDYDLEEYDEEKLVHPDFIPILNAAKKTILEPIKELIVLYHNLPYGDKITLQVALNNNNSTTIFDDLNLLPIQYEQLNPLISKKLKDFFESLWNEYPQVVAMENGWGSVKNHYDKLIDDNNFDFLVCPFCGIDTFEPAGDKYREAYDHLIAKSKYPFASINFKLLFPCCFKCNSNEKRKSDTIYTDDQKRRVAFYPYDQNIRLDDLIINIKLNEKYNDQNLETLLKSINWEFEIIRKGISDPRDESWDLIYRIKERFKKRVIRLEKQWFDELKRLFKNGKDLGQNFVDYKSITLENLKYQIPIVGMGIIKYFYFNFVFSIPDIEKKLIDIYSL